MIARLRPTPEGRIKTHLELLEKLPADRRAALQAVVDQELERYVGKERGRLARKISRLRVAGVLVGSVSTVALIVWALGAGDNEGVALLVATAVVTATVTSAMASAIYARATQEEVPDLVATFETALN